jgi:1,4-dihydroxy-6-naphthoate synthase
MAGDRPLRIVCSPDADDKFMMWALTHDRIPTGDWRPEITTAPTDQLNELVGPDGPDVLALSVARWPAAAPWYRLLPHGGSFGDDYGPILVAPNVLDPADLAGQPVGVPGLTTTAATVLRMLIDIEPVVLPIVPHERVFQALREGEVAAALLIHEGRLTFEDEGMVPLVDLGVWWARATGGLPLPLGVNGLHRRLDGDDAEQVSRLIRASIAWALDHRDEVIDDLLASGGALRDRERLDLYLQMYANHRTLDPGPDGRTAVELLLEQAAAMSLLPECEIDWAPEGV